MIMDPKKKAYWKTSIEDVYIFIMEDAKSVAFD